jgi:hypothetical protein
MVWITLWITRRYSVQNLVDNSMHLTSALRFMLSREPVCRCSSQRVVKLMGALCLLLGSIAINVQPASANNIDMLKLYAHSRIVNDKQYQCFTSLIHKENRTWDVNAKNGSHYGIGQMRSKHYRTLDAYRQIDATLRYIDKRYSKRGNHGAICNAWAFHQKHGWY